MRRFVVPTLFLAACGFANLAARPQYASAQPAPAQPPPATAPAGLDSLTDDALLSELAARGLSNLLERAMEVDQVPPAHDPLSHLVYVTRGDDVETTIVNGKVLMRNRKVVTLDETAILREARMWAEKVRTSVAPAGK